MSTLERLNEAVKIIAQYDDSPMNLHAEHDVIYVGPQNAEALDPENMAPADREALEAISGIHWNDDLLCWAIFT